MESRLEDESAVDEFGPMKLQRIAKLLKIVGLLVLVFIVRTISFITRNIHGERKLLGFLNNFYDKPVIGGRKGPEDYFLWQFSSAKKIYDYVQDESFSFKGKTIVDIGCGRGGKTAFYSSEGAAMVAGLDLRQDALEIATQFAKKHGLDKNACFVKCDAKQLPFHDRSFDLIICDDVVEHIAPAHLRCVFDEAKSVLKPNGSVIVDFSPYYNPRGSHLYDIVYIPYCHLLFSKKALTKYCEDKASLFIIQQFQELNRITANQFCAIVNDCGFNMEEKQVIKLNNLLKDVPVLENLFISKFFCVLGVQ